MTTCNTDYCEECEHLENTMTERCLKTNDDLNPYAYNILLSKINILIKKELNSSIEKYQYFIDPHQGESILREEFDELVAEVRKKPCERDFKLMKEEAIQVAAMAIKFIIGIEQWKNI